ncbi:LysR family transcriptional regulator [Sphaerisporangium krabiense]|uniref:Molybdate transport repressor ModE-like protein n=1 Tax=Sphaerisporangium krabiense TaxID=763782 RepID=A0A7W9DNI7_9ACTN|nr:LysR family transcriptional regulator [Sphaerisporangium krabiense]MBB5625432.1 molybdate transport repressor ModE-like protein [Sphaerisporangium krabiense]GII64054.1 LysR family transcriptional regulator [Sphaerisporangium krabiense]
MLNLDRLRVLHAVATTGSVVGAARTLHVTTSAISQQVGRLEREMGQRLVERRGRGVRLTEAGELLARHAGELLAHAERVESGMAEHRGVVAGSLTIAAFATAARGLLPGALRDLRARHPELSVALAEREPHEAIPDLRRGRLDVTVAQDWAEDVTPAPDGLMRRDLLDDTFDVALPDAHPLAGRDRVAVGELAGDDWISWSAGQICHDWLVRTLRAEGGEPRVAHTASEHSTQLALVAAGLGVAVIPRLGREQAPPSVRYVRIDPPPIRRVFALWRESAAGRPAIGAAVAALRRQAALDRG